MLTERERKWLELRKNVCFRCKKRRQTCSLQLRDDCLNVGYPIRDLAMISQPDYADAAEFEARVAVIALRLGIEDVPCAHGMDMFCPAKHFKGQGCGDWCRLRMAHLQAEEEMDNARG